MTQEYFNKHLSLSQWALETNIFIKDDLIKEDATKRQRLDVLNRTLGLPTVKVHSFNYEDITQISAAFSSFLDASNVQLNALRVNPRKDGLPVQRNRKLTVAELVRWVSSLNLEFEEYEYNFELHIDPEMSGIFTVSHDRIAGEAACGGILQLNKGIHDGAPAIRFEYDFTRWRYSAELPPVRNFLESAIRYLRVSDPGIRESLQNELGSSFAHEYLKGYFEVVTSASSGIVFNDYNRILQNNIDGLELFSADGYQAAVELTGQVGCTGLVIGKARVVTEQDIHTGIALTPDEILICAYTSPELVPLMTQAAAVVTDVGGILSHAAIVCRELKKPCVVGTRLATRRLRTGDHIEVDATNGRVKLR